MNRDTIADIERRQKALNSSDEKVVASLMRDIFVNKDGTDNKSPFFSKRGHVAETLRAYSLYQNIVSGLGDDQAIHIATDRVGINGPSLPVNDQYRDIIVENINDNLIKSYQSKVYSSGDKSIAAAAASKYRDKGVIPLVPSDQDSRFGNISAVINGKTYKSDEYSLDVLSRITEALESGKAVPVFSSNKMELLHKNVLDRGTTEGAKTAFFNSSIRELANCVANHGNDQRTFMQKAAGILAGTIDGMTRSAFVAEAAFSSKNKQLASTIAGVAYDSAKSLWNNLFASGGAKMPTAISDAFHLDMEVIGSTFGKAFGPVGAVVGKTVGGAFSSFIKKASFDTILPMASKAIGKTIGTLSGCASAMGGAIKTIGKNVVAVAGSVASHLGAGIALGAKCIAGVGLLGAVASILLDIGDAPVPSGPRREEIIDEKLGEMRNVSEAYRDEIDNIYSEYNEILPYAGAESLKAIIVSSVKREYIDNLCAISKEISDEETCFYDSIAKQQSIFEKYVNDSQKRNAVFSAILDNKNLDRLTVQEAIRSIDIEKEMKGSGFISRRKILRSMD